MYRPSYYGLWLPDTNKDWLIDWLPFNCVLDTTKDNKPPVVSRTLMIRCCWRHCILLHHQPCETSRRTDTNVRCLSGWVTSQKNTILYTTTCILCPIGVDPIRISLISFHHKIQSSQAIVGHYLRYFMFSRLDLRWAHEHTKDHSMHCISTASHGQKHYSKPVRK